MKKVLLAVGVCLLLVFKAAGQGGPERSAGHPPIVPQAVSTERLVPMEPCRLLDTRTTPPASPVEESMRSIDVAATRCGRLVPKVATGYAIRRISYNREQLNPPTAPPSSELPSRHSAGAPLTFPLAASEHIALDLEGYFVPAGTPLDPAPSETTPAGLVQPDGASPAVSAASLPSLRIKAEAAAVGGTLGQLYLDGSYPNFGMAGFLGVGTSTASPLSIMKTSTSDGTGGFAVYNSNSQPLMTIRSDGLATFMNFPLNTAYDYHGSVSFPNDVASTVRVTNPKDHLGGNANAVVFFKARSDDEAPTGQTAADLSPVTTKFQAFTLGYYGQKHINFDSQIQYHWAAYQNHYHFRAYSPFEDKDTFWVKAATRGDYGHNTTADMYVSGMVGIGTPAPSTSLDVTDAVYAGARLAIGQQASVLRAGYNSFYYSELASYIPAGASGVDSIGWKIRPYYYGAGGRFDAVTVTPTGKVGIGIEPTALLQLAPPAGTAGFSQSANGTFYIDASGVSGGRLAILEDGRVGVGVPNPDARFEVLGTGHFTGNVTVDGTVYAKYQDVAEWVSAAEGMAAGTVVVVSEDADNTVTASRHAYDTSVAGVVSSNPGLLLGVASASKAKIATTGRVRVRVDATASPIRKGDLLVTSDRPGMAMKSEPLDLGGVKIHRPGTLIGKALEPLASGEGEILVLLSLQ
jgi:hypothetical protein